LRPPRESEWSPRALLPGRPFTDSAGPGAGFHWYRARWVGRSGGRSLWSAPVRVTVLGGQAPPADPPSLTAQPVECGGVRLTWSPVLDAGGYTVERAEPGAPFTSLAELGGTDLSYVDTDVEPGRAYRYRVLAENSAGASPGRTIAQATSSSSQFTLGLSSSAVAVPPGRSAAVDVGVTRHGGAFDVELAFEAGPELAGAVDVALAPRATAGDSVATISVDPRAGTGLVVRGTVVARASAPGAGTCTAPLTVHVGRPSCEITMPDVRLRPTAGTQLVDLFIERTGFARRTGLTVRFDDTAFETYATLSFVPNPAAGRSTAVIDVLRDLPGSGHATTALVRAVPPEGVARPCGRQVRLIFPAS
jgi:hypothetical protein